MSQKSSFQRKSKGKGFQIPGVKPSLHNNQLLISTGIPSLDSILGGGLAVGTVMLIEEDKFCSYSKLMLKYFIAEGVVCGHSVLLSSADEDTESLLKDLPGPVIDDPGGKEVPGQKASDDSMKIAWRYQHLPQSAGAASSRFGHYYDLTKTMEPAVLESVDKRLVNIDASKCDVDDVPVIKPAYVKVLREISHMISTGQFSTSAQPATRNILRIGIHSLGSPLWGEGSGSSTDGSVDPSISRFLFALRGLMRQAFAVCVLTVPTHLFQDPVGVRHLELLVDTMVQLDSFAGSAREKNPAFSEYHGLFQIKKLPRLNSLTCHMPDTLDLAFKLKRKKFMIEKLHLPPELSETASRSQEDPVSRAGCSTGTGANKLDF